MMTTIYTLAKLCGTDARSLVKYLRHGRSIGEIAWDKADRDEAAELELDGWPECECTACGCSNPATTTDDGGIPVCWECANYTVDTDGDVHCMRCGDVEMVSESCGAGNQMRSYARLIPPAMPDADPDGTYSVWWETVGDDAHLVARYTTGDLAKQAVEAHDFPAPGDHTNYLCGYGVRELISGRWASVEEE